MTPIDLITHWRTKADDYLRASKAYQCRANSEARAGYVKGAAVLCMCAGQLEKVIAEANESAIQSRTPEPVTDRRPRVTRRSMAEGRIDEAPSGQSVTGQEPAHQDTGSLDVPGVPQGDDGVGDRSSDSIE